MIIDRNMKAAPRGIFQMLAGLAALTSRLGRKHTTEALNRERSTRTLFFLYRLTVEAHTREQALDALQQELERLLDAKVSFFLPPGALHSELVIPLDVTLNDADRKALESAWNTMETSGLGTALDADASWRFEPMLSGVGKVGVLGIKPNNNGKPDAWLSQLLTEIALQTALILQHIGLKQSLEDNKLQDEREKLRTMLLSSVSHDFKTPLAGIIGALSVYRSLGAQLPEEKRTALVETAIDEAQRLDNFVTNILDMARLESGSVMLREEWHEVDGMIENVLRRMKPRCRNHSVHVISGPPGVEVRMDLLMTEQVLQNIIDNACKYTQAGTQIELRCHADQEEGFLFEIRDYGTGIPAQNLELIFDKYTRLHKKDMQVAGTGLGLAIAKAVMQAQGGWIKAANHMEGGAIFTLCLPHWRISQNLMAKEA